MMITAASFIRWRMALGGAVSLPAVALAAAPMLWTPPHPSNTLQGGPFDLTIEDRVRRGNPSAPSARNGLFVSAQAGTTVYARGLDFSALKYGVTLRKTGESRIADLHFRDIASPDRFGGAIRLGGGRGRQTLGPTYLSNIDAEGGDAPSADYAAINTDFLIHERGNAPVYLRYVTARGFSDALIDAKSTVYIANATLEGSYRELRAHDGATIVIIDSVVNSPDGGTIAWLGGPDARILYRNVLWNGQPDPDPAWIQGWSQESHATAPAQVTRLEDGLLPAPFSSDPFFAGRIETVRFERQGAAGWVALEGASFGSPGRAWAGDAVFPIELPGSGAIIRARITELGRTGVFLTAPTTLSGGAQEVDLPTLQTD